MLTSTRRQIQYPNPDRSDRPDIPLHFLNLINASERETEFEQGTEAHRLTVSHYTGGGKFYYATDTGSLWYDDGAAWHQIGDPTGTIKMWPGNTAPAGYVLCDGASYDSVALTQYAPLFAIIGISFGGTGASAFNVPDLRGRGPIGKGTNGSVNTIGQNDGVAVGSRTGAIHHHVVQGVVTGATGFDGFQQATNLANQDSDTSGGGMQDGPAFLVINFAIKL